MPLHKSPSRARSRHIGRSDQLNRQLFLGFVRTHILLHAIEASICGVEITEELGRHGYRMSPGTLYPILHDLASAGYLKCAPKVESGRVRKYYTGTARGRWALGEAKKRLKELVEEVLDEKR